MLFLVPIFATAVESALAYESVAMFATGAYTAASVFRHD